MGEYTSSKCFPSVATSHIPEKQTLSKRECYAHVLERERSFWPSIMRTNLSMYAYTYILPGSNKTCKYGEEEISSFFLSYCFSGISDLLFIHYGVHKLDLDYHLFSYSTARETVPHELQVFLSSCVCGAQFGLHLWHMCKRCSGIHPTPFS